MKYRTLLFFTISIIIISISCQSNNIDKIVGEAKEKSLITEKLQSETELAFARNYDAWQNCWVHRNNISKTYINFVDSTHSESIGWQKIDGFVKDFFEKHPEPEPAPKIDFSNIDIRFYGNAAWVNYTQQDSLRGLKRESRLMEKENGDWKIAGMHTSIYGFNHEE